MAQVTTEQPSIPTFKEVIPQPVIPIVQENPYLTSVGAYTLTKSEIAFIKVKLAAARPYQQLTLWYREKKAEILKGFVTDNDLPEVEAFFERLVRETAAKQAAEKRAPLSKELWTEIRKESWEAYMQFRARNS